MSEPSFDDIFGGDEAVSVDDIFGSTEDQISIEEIMGAESTQAGRPSGETLEELQERYARLPDAGIDTIDGEKPEDVRNYFMLGASNPFNVLQLAARNDTLRRLAGGDGVTAEQVEKVINADAEDGGWKYGVGQGVSETLATSMAPGGGAWRGLAQAAAEGGVSELNRSGWEADNLGAAARAAALSAGTDAAVRYGAGALGKLGAGLRRPEAPEPFGPTVGEAAEGVGRRAMDWLDEAMPSDVPGATMADDMGVRFDAPDMPPPIEIAPRSAPMVRHPSNDAFTPDPEIMREVASWPKIKEAREWARILMSDNVARKTGAEPINYDLHAQEFLGMTPAQRLEYLRKYIPAPQKPVDEAAEAASVAAGRAVGVPTNAGRRGAQGVSHTADTVPVSGPPAASPGRSMPPPIGDAADTVVSDPLLVGARTFPGGPAPDAPMPVRPAQPPNMSIEAPDVAPVPDPDWVRSLGQGPRQPPNMSIDAPFRMTGPGRALGGAAGAVRFTGQALANRAVSPETAARFARNYAETTGIHENIVDDNDYAAAVDSVAQFFSPGDDVASPMRSALVEAYSSPALEAYPGLRNELAEVLFKLDEGGGQDLMATMAYKLSEVPGLQWEALNPDRDEDN